MVRISKPLGFLTGLILGVITRENYLYPYPIRVEELHDDYYKLIENVNKREEELNTKIDKMTQQLDQAQGLYVTRKFKNLQSNSSSDSSTPSEAVKPELNYSKGNKGDIK